MFYIIIISSLFSLIYIKRMALLFQIIYIYLYTYCLFNPADETKRNWYISLYVYVKKLTISIVGPILIYQDLGTFYDELTRFSEKYCFYAFFAQSEKTYLWCSIIIEFFKICLFPPIIFEAIFSQSLYLQFSSKLSIT